MTRTRISPDIQVGLGLLIHPKHFDVIRVCGAGAAVTSGGIAPVRQDGRKIVIRGTSDVNTVTIPHGAAYNTHLLDAADVTLSDGDEISLRWNETKRLWLVGEWTIFS